MSKHRQLHSVLTGNFFTVLFDCWTHILSCLGRPVSRVWPSKFSLELENWTWVKISRLSYTDFCKTSILKFCFDHLGWGLIASVLISVPKCFLCIEIKDDKCHILFLVEWDNPTDNCSWIYFPSVETCGLICSVFINTFSLYHTFIEAFWRWNVLPRTSVYFQWHWPYTEKLLFCTSRFLGKMKIFAYCMLFTQMLCIQWFVLLNLFSLWNSSPIFSSVCDVFVKVGSDIELFCLSRNGS